MTGRWAESLPDVSGAPIEDRRLRSVRYAAAYVRAWRKSLPAEYQEMRVRDWADAPTDVLLGRAVRYILYAADRGPLEGSWLRDVESALRTVGKRWVRELES